MNKQDVKKMTNNDQVQPLPVPENGHPFVRSAYNYDTDQASFVSGLACSDPSLAIQSQADEANINTIVRRFGVTGLLPESFKVPEYGDFEGPSSYHEAMTYVVEAQGAFSALPAAMRAEFNNDPGEFLAYMEDPDNREAVFETFGVSIDGFQPSPAPTPSPSLTSPPEPKGA